MAWELLDGVDFGRVFFLYNAGGFRLDHSTLPSWRVPRERKMSEDNPTATPPVTHTEFRDMVRETRELVCGNDGSSYERCLHDVKAIIIKEDVKLLKSLRGMCNFSPLNLQDEVVRCASLIDALAYMQREDNCIRLRIRKNREDISKQGYGPADMNSLLMRFDQSHESAQEDDWHSSVIVYLEQMSHPTQTMVMNNEGLNEFSSIIAACNQVLKDRLRSCISA